MQYIVRLLGENKSNSFLLFSVCCGSTGGKKKKTSSALYFYIHGKQAQIKGARTLIMVSSNSHIFISAF